MKIIYPLLFLILSISFFSCRQEEEKQKVKAEFINPQLGAGGRFYGGVLRLNYNRYPESLYPPAVTSSEGKEILSQIYEGLFRIDSQGELVPRLAEKFSVNADYTRYRIFLKKGIRFHKDDAFSNTKARELTAQDVVYVLKRLCTYHPENKHAELFVPVIKGAQSYYNRSRQKEMGDLLPDGLVALSDTEVSIILNAPDPEFLEKFSRPAAYIYPREMLENYSQSLQSHAIGTGPFQLEHQAKDITIILRRNPDYHQSDEYDNPLPYLDALSYQFIKDEYTELREFAAGKLDVLHSVGHQRLVELLQNSKANGKGEIKEVALCLEPSRQTTLLSIMPRKKILRSLNFRKALNFALDRQKIMRESINNEAFAPAWQGLVPPVDPAYPAEKMQTYRYSLDSALHYLELSAYQFGAEAPLLIAYRKDKEQHERIAETIAGELLSFGILAEAQGFAEEVWQEQARTGNYDLLLFELQASSPAEYLYQFYPAKLKAWQKQPVQVYGFSRQFAEYFRNALQARQREEWYRKLSQAEQYFHQEASAVVLWYGAKNTVMRSYIENYPCQEAPYLFFAEVYYRKAINL